MSGTWRSAGNGLSRLTCPFCHRPDRSAAGLSTSNNGGGVSGATEYGLICLRFHAVFERPAPLRQWHRRGFQPRRRRPVPKNLTGLPCHRFVRSIQASHLQSHFGDGEHYRQLALSLRGSLGGLLTEAEFEQCIRSCKEGLSSPYALTQISVVGYFGRAPRVQAN